MGIFRETQRSNTTKSVGSIMKCLQNFCEYNKKRIEKAPKLNAIINSPIDVSTLKVVGYLGGNKVDRCEGLTLNHFEYVEYLKESVNPIKKDKFHHFLCRTGGMVTIVICKVK